MAWLPYIRGHPKAPGKRLASEWGRKVHGDSPPAKPSKEVTTGSDEATSGTIARCASNPNPENLPSLSTCEPFSEAIELGLSRRRNAAAIWHDLVSENGFRGGYQTVKRFVRKLCGAQTLVPRAVIVTEPGQEAQVEYGRSPMVAIHTAANIDAPACSG